MHSVNNTKFTDAQEAKAIYNFKNTKENFCRINTAIWYNKILHVGLMILCCF